jgi:hypothetical protein
MGQLLDDSLQGQPPQQNYSSQRIVHWEASRYWDKMGAFHPMPVPSGEELGLSRK